MSVKWPENLVEEIAYRRCIIFTGAGLSATATNAIGNHPPSWADFINGLFEKAKSTQMTNANKNFIKKCITQKNFLMALEALYNNSITDSGERRSYINSSFRAAGYTPSEAHKAIFEIDSRLIITTNFDMIYESLTSHDTTTVAKYSDITSIIESLKSNRFLVIKAHGSVDAVDDMVFSQSQYSEYRNKNEGFLKILEALFITQTVLFIGYSVSDPDIKLMMENLALINRISAPHYILLQTGQINHIEKSYWESTYKLNVVEYSGKDFVNFTDSIIQLKNEVLTLRQSRGI